MLTKCPHFLAKILVTGVISLAPFLMPAGLDDTGRALAQSSDVPASEAPASEAKAETEPTFAIVKTDEALTKIASLKEKLAAAAARFREDKLSDDDYVALESDILDITEAAEQISLEFQPRVQSIEMRLAELKPVGEGAEQSETAKLEEESQRKVLMELGGVMVSGPVARRISEAL